jgi:hypothetical protein
MQNCDASVFSVCRKDRSVEQFANCAGLTQAPTTIMLQALNRSAPRALVCPDNLMPPAAASPNATQTKTEILV